MPVSSTTPADVGPLVVKPKVAWQMLACSNTRGYELLAAGALDSFLDGRSRKITVESIHRYIAQRVASTQGTTAQSKSPRRKRGRPRKPSSAITERSCSP
jgi:hypothetical protein